MKIEIVERDYKNGHYDIYVERNREFEIRGEKENYYIRQKENKKIYENFKSAKNCLMFIFKILVQKI